MEAAVINAVDQLSRFSPLVVLAVTAVWLALATRRTSASIGSRAFGFGRSVRQRLARLLFVGEIAGAVLALMAYATGATSTFLEPMAGEASIVRLAGLTLAVGGEALTLFALGDMGRLWQVGVPEKAPGALITTSLFGLSRNPAFLGMLALAAGLAVAVPSPTMIAFAVAFWAACEIQVRDEERFLQRSFGPAHTAYRGAVRRWI